MQTISAARTEADDIRRSARKMLMEARSEVAALTERRNAIAGELGNLSGIIEALAVTETETETTPSDNGAPGPAGSGAESSDEPQPEQDQPMSLLTEKMTRE